MKHLEINVSGNMKMWSVFMTGRYRSVDVITGINISVVTMATTICTLLWEASSKGMKCILLLYYSSIILCYCLVSTSYTLFKSWISIIFRPFDVIIQRTCSNFFHHGCGFNWTWKRLNTNLVCEVLYTKYTPESEVPT